jgi:hypothetical protein
MNLAQSSVSAIKLAAKWNASFPKGTRVRYWTGRREGLGKESMTRSGAEVVGTVAVVWIDGVAGCVALSHVEPLP